MKVSNLYLFFSFTYDMWDFLFHNRPVNNIARCVHIDDVGKIIDFISHIDMSC